MIRFLAAILLTSVIPLVAHGECFKAQDVAPVIRAFPQFQALQQRSEVCAHQLDAATFTVLQTLMDIRNIEIDPLPKSHTVDDLSVRPLEARGWWDYLAERANRFNLSPGHCGPLAIAYVDAEVPGEVNLCPPFFDYSRAERASVLLHEVRHFDGFAHVTCTRGLNAGQRGGCDPSLSMKGSYAVSVQANVAIGLGGKTFSAAERALSRAAAITVLNNKFNEPTQIRLRSSLYILDARGTVWDWLPDAPELAPRRVKKLERFSRIYSSNLDVVLYPFNLAHPAVRFADEFQTKRTLEMGTIANQYNQDAPVDRRRYRAISYESGGGVLTDDLWRGACSGKLMDYPLQQLSDSIVTVLAMKPTEDSGPRTYLLGKSGKLFIPDCLSSRAIVGNTAFRMPSDIQMTVPVGERLFALMQNGRLFELSRQKTVFTVLGAVDMRGPIGPYVSIARRITPYLYEESLSARSP